jgi:DNA relaxase NicK
MIAACILLKLGKACDAADAISQVRSLRGFRAVQTTRQEEFVHFYNSAWLTQTRSCDHNQVAVVPSGNADALIVQLPGKSGCLVKRHAKKKAA